MPHRILITGATGFVGGHVAEACKARGDEISTIARANSDTTLLDRLGATIHRGDLTDPAVIHKAVDGVDVIVNCAAKVGDRGPVEEFRPVNVDSLRHLLDACKGRPLRRFVHVSSLGVYEARHHYGTTEAEPLPDQHIDSYTTTKVEADKLAQAYYREHKIPIVILRPGFIYGPRDRTVLPRLIKRLADGKVHYLGGDQRALNSIYVGNLVEAILLAIDNPNAVGQVFNLTDGEYVSKRRFVEAVAAAMGLPGGKQRVPAWLAKVAVAILKRQMKSALAKGKKPWISPAQFKFINLNLDFSIDKAKKELGYQPKWTFDQAIHETMAWYRQNA